MQKVILTCVMRSGPQRGGLESRAKKKPEILTCVGLADFWNKLKTN
ncbi:hypothetical protein [Pseudomonas sp. GM74]|nr:hypothetical protein [Pseudomonas sp. GM74]